MKKLLPVIFIFLFSFATFGQDLPEAATFTVTNLNDSGSGSLRQAIRDAELVAGDDTINFQTGLSGAITLTSSELLINSNVAINGTPLITVTRSTVDGTPNFRILNIVSGTNVSINNLTISGGSLSIQNAQGGGIYNAGTLSINNSSISGNFAGCMFPSCSPVTIGLLNGAGGGIYNVGSITITNSNVNDNIAGIQRLVNDYSEGGGIYNTGTMTLVNSSVANNKAIGSPGNNTAGDARGGGIYSNGTGTVDIINSPVRDNTASASRAYGGGIYSLGVLNITNSEITNNSAAGGGNTPSISAGGGIFGIGTIINSTISNNRSAARNQQVGIKGAVVFMEREL